MSSSTPSPTSLKSCPTSKSHLFPSSPSNPLSTASSPFKVTSSLLTSSTLKNAPNFTSSSAKFMKKPSTTSPACYCSTELSRSMKNWGKFMNWTLLSKSTSMTFLTITCSSSKPLWLSFRFTAMWSTPVTGRKKQKKSSRTVQWKRNWSACSSVSELTPERTPTSSWNPKRTSRTSSYSRATTW